MMFVEMGRIPHKLKSVKYVQMLGFFYQSGTTATSVVPVFRVNIKIVFLCIWIPILKVRYYFIIIHILIRSDLSIDTPRSCSPTQTPNQGSASI